MIAILSGIVLTFSGLTNHGWQIVSGMAHLSISIIRPGLEMLSPSLPGFSEPALMAVIGLILISLALFLRRRSFGNSLD